MKLFGRKQGVELMAYATGTIVPLQEVHDEMFSAGLMGQGIAIASIDGKFYSPINGEITMLFPTKHALGMKTEEGHELLLHIGIDTVSLQGEGFKAYVESGSKVVKGDLLLEVDLALIKEKGFYSEAILCITEPKNIQITFTLEKTVKAKEDSIATIKK